MNKKHIAFFLAILINLTSMNAQKLKTEIDSVSYCIGVNIGENLKNQFSDIDIKDFMNGMNDVLDKKSEPKISNAEAQKILQEYFTKQQEMISTISDYLADSKYINNDINMVTAYENIFIYIYI